ncbi:MAG: LCP family protein, partial [Clostridia bacterium]|nr:LCP family protein [Clostridia bacterium]
MTNPQNDLPVKNNEEKSGKSKKTFKIIIAVLISVLAAIALVLILVYAISYYGKQSLLGSEISVSAPEELAQEVEDDGSVVLYNGKKYVYNENVVSFLFLGVEDIGVNENSEIGKKGQADTLFLATLDTKSGAIKIIPVSRETMVDINIYSTEGNYAGVENTQLCLAYAYGKDNIASCQNVVRSVSRLFYGVEINSYLSVNLEGFEKIVDALGGVKVTVLEDIKKYDVTLKKGETKTLKGKEALIYVRERGNSVDANNLRMQKQKQFLTAMLNTAGNKIFSDFTKLSSYYNILKPYTTTDLTFSQISYLATTFLTANIGNSVEYINITGESSMHNGSACFIPDKASVYDAVI